MKSRFYCRLKKVGKFVTGFSLCLTAISALWIQFGLPIPATAGDLKKVTARQAEIGIKVQLQTERDIRRDLFDLRWKLRELENEKGNDQLNALRKALQEQIGELEAREAYEREIREKYVRRLQKLE